AVPGLYDYCEAHGLSYAFGYATNAVLQRATAQALADLELYHHFYRHREPVVQRFEAVANYQADGWPHPRRIVAKIEVTPQGSRRRLVVPARPEPAAVVYRDFYVQRGRVPEQPIGEMKNGLQADRLSACGFCANAFRLLVHTLAYAIVVLFREAVAAVPEVATASVSTLRQRLGELGAVGVTTARRGWVAPGGGGGWAGGVGGGVGSGRGGAGGGAGKAGGGRRWGGSEQRREAVPQPPAPAAGVRRPRWVGPTATGAAAVMRNDSCPSGLADSKHGDTDLTEDFPVWPEARCAIRASGREVDQGKTPLTLLRDYEGKGATDEGTRSHLEMSPCSTEGHSSLLA